MKSRLLFMGVIAVFLFSSFFPSGAARAEGAFSFNETPSLAADNAEGSLLAPGQDASKCWALDIVLVMDQSGSMWEEMQGGGSDPLGYRFEAAKQIITRLARNRRYECTEAAHRFAVVTFNSHAKVALPMTTINFRVDKSFDLDQWMKGPLSKIDAARAQDDRTNTDFISGFELARQVLDEAGPMGDEPEGYGPRRSAVILLTDGQPTSKNGEQVQNVSTYMKDFVDYLNQPEWSSTYMFIEALSASHNYLNLPGSENGNSIRNDFEQIAAAHNGKLYQLQYNEQMIPAFISDMVDLLFGIPGEKITCGQSFYIDPYKSLGRIHLL